ncbi:MucBP domain-containing protein [Weissella sp. LMG 11983]|uniref:MucBP domain-containing protein n=1 Tax=Weissella sp. LMG 11983 TaxID=2987700 RepID=UPI0021F8285E|nr:MucBP domain-containing protein [Weissella sp. LMG 11983]MCW0927805.1 MucBP domain-containing protein [Weissella sp. LMG 11983]
MANYRKLIVVPIIVSELILPTKVFGDSMSPQTMRKIDTSTVSNVNNTNNKSINNFDSTSENVASGIFGTSLWELDSSGVLHIGAGEFAYTDTSSPWNNWAPLIKRVVFEGKVIAGARSNYLFKDFINVTEFDKMENFDMSNVVGAADMWKNNKSLESLDLSFSRAGQNAKTLQNGGMFEGCVNLEYLDLRSVKFSYNYFSAFKDDAKLSRVTVDKSLNLYDKGKFPGIPESKQYTGKWVNVGDGTISNPAGSIVVDTTDIFGSNPNLPEDTYVWQENTITVGKPVTVQYVDTEGNKLAEDTVKSGNIDEEYTTEQKTLPGYTLKEIRGSSEW